MLVDVAVGAVIMSLILSFKVLDDFFRGYYKYQVSDIDVLG